MKKSLKLKIFRLHKNTLVILLVMISITSCSKDHTVNLRSNVSVRYLEDEYNIYIDHVDADWQRSTGKATMIAYGYDNQVFYLDLEALKDTGIVKSISAKNIGFSDGRDFNSDSLYDGVIRVSDITDNSITGEFKVALSDNYNGAETRVIVGGFNINMPN